MCPDHETLSAYFDGEIDLPWAKAIEEHLLECPACKQKVSDFYSVKEFLSKYRETAIYGPMERVWSKITSSSKEIKYLSAWNKRISIPFPAAVFAACFIVLFGVISIFSFFKILQNDFGMMKITRNLYGITEVQVEGPMQSIEEILNSLDKTNFTDEVTINLPVESEFFIVGEPIYLKAEGFDWPETVSVPKNGRLNETLGNNIEGSVK